MVLILVRDGEAHRRLDNAHEGGREGDQRGGGVARTEGFIFTACAFETRKAIWRLHNT